MAITGGDFYNNDDVDEEQTESNDAVEDEYEDFEIVDFLTGNRDLFAVMGVFAALSVYIPRLSNDSEPSTGLKIGFASSVIICLVVIYAIFKNANEKYGVISDFGNYLFSANKESYEYFVFTVPFVALIISLLSVGTTYTASVTFLIKMTVILFGFTIPKYGFDLLSKYTDIDNYNQENSSVIEFIKYSSLTVLIPISVFFISLYAMGYNAQQHGVEILNVLSISSKDPVISIVSAFFLGSLISSGMFVSIFPVIVILFVWQKVNQVRG